MTERIDLERADDPRDVVHRIVACLAQGGVVGLPTETTYGIVGGANHPAAVASLRDLAAPRRAPLPAFEELPCLLLRSPGEVADWADVATELGRRWIRRAWPGPLTLVLPRASQGMGPRLPPEVGPFLVPDGHIALRVTASKMAREVIRLAPGPLIQVEYPARDGRAATRADDLIDATGLDMIVDVGTTELRGLPAIIAVQGDRWSIVRAGVVPEQQMGQLAATILLFICTGNTCRSPMAEALCKASLARRLGCAADSLADRGVFVLSAGISASEGRPAAENAVEVVSVMGGSLLDHGSRRATPDLVRHADHIIAMTADHIDALIDRLPDVAPRARLLDASGDDIEDPIGADIDVYHQTARQIRAHLERLLDDLGF